MARDTQFGALATNLRFKKGELVHQRVLLVVFPILVSACQIVSMDPPVSTGSFYWLSPMKEKLRFGMKQKCCQTISAEPEQIISLQLM